MCLAHQIMVHRFVILYLVLEMCLKWVGVFRVRNLIWCLKLEVFSHSWEREGKENMWVNPPVLCMSCKCESLSTDPMTLRCKTPKSSTFPFIWRSQLKEKGEAEEGRVKLRSLERNKSPRGVTRAKLTFSMYYLQENLSIFGRSSFPQRQSYIVAMEKYILPLKQSCIALQCTLPENLCDNLIFTCLQSSGSCP